MASRRNCGTLQPDKCFKPVNAAFMSMQHLTNSDKSEKLFVKLLHIVKPKAVDEVRNI